jgi:gas vesicle protein
MFKTIKGLITGLVAGASLGVLFAPKKGKDLRKDIKNERKKGGSGLKTIQKTATELGENIKDSAVETYEDVANSDVVKKAKKTAASVKKKATKTAASAKKQVKKVAKKIKKS